MFTKQITVIIALILLATTVPISVDSVTCPLKTKKTYKTKTNPSVYYITAKCTKRIFIDEKTYFTYFKSWKNVKIVKSITLKKIHNDKLGQMTPKKKIAKKPTSPIPTKSETPTSTPKTTTPPPVVIPDPAATTPEPKSTLSGVIEQWLTCPAQAEVIGFDNDFDLRFKDKESYQWSDYPYLCDYSSKNPSRLMTYATLRLLKQLEFEKSLPFTKGQSLYDYLTLKTLADTKLDNPKLIINPLLECLTYSTGGWMAKTINGITSYTLEVNMSGVFSRVYPVLSGTTNCQSALPEGSFTSQDLINNFIYHPIYRAALFVHEAHHAIARKPHTGANGADATIEEMGAWATQFYFNAWVALYSTNTDTQTKQLAKFAAQSILTTRFTESKCPSDSDLKSVVNKIKNNTCL